VIGLFCVLWGTLFISVAYEAFGILLGIVGFALGARLATIPAISPADAACFQAAKEIFESDPETYVFVYGHTHNASLRRVGNRVVINTGTWLKKLERVTARSRLLPSVYRPSFRLNYFRIGEDQGRITIDYERIQKAAPRDLSLLQRLVAKKPQRDALQDIPERTVIE